MRRTKRVALFSIGYSLAIIPGETIWSQTPPVAVARNAPQAEITSEPSLAKSTRLISGHLAASLAAGLPKYSPPPLPLVKEVGESRGSDQPRNGIIRLPKYTVQERKIPVFNEYELLTSEGRIHEALKRHPGLKFGPLSKWNEGWGLKMLAEEERLYNIADLEDTARAISQADKADGAYLKRLTDRAYMRTGGSGYKSGPRD